MRDEQVIHADAAAHTWRWDTVSELVDTDTGSWQIHAGDETYVLDLDQRAISLRLTAGMTKTQEPKLSRLIGCRENEPLSWAAMGPGRDRSEVERRSLQPITTITRLDSSSRRPAGQQSRTAPDKPRPRRETLAVATETFEALIADVASRYERLFIETPRGEAVIVPGEYFDLVIEQALITREIMSPKSETLDAATVRDADQDIVELRDTDTGIWHLITDRIEYVLDLDRRSIRTTRIEDDWEWKPGSRTPITSVDHCRVGDPLRIDGVIEPLSRGDVVHQITRLEEWSFG